MPVHPPSEETPSAALTGKDPASTSTTSKQDTPTKASAQDHQGKGPQIPVDMGDLPPKAGKEELKKRSEELNR